MFYPKSNVTLHNLIEEYWFARQNNSTAMPSCRNFTTNQFLPISFRLWQQREVWFHSFRQCWCKSASFTTVLWITSSHIQHHTVLLSHMCHHCTSHHTLTYKNKIALAFMCHHRTFSTSSRHTTSYSNVTLNQTVLFSTSWDIQHHTVMLH